MQEKQKEADLTWEEICTQKEKDGTAEWIALGKPRPAPPAVADLMVQDEAYKQSIFDKTWEEIYGFLPGVNDK